MDKKTFHTLIDKYMAGTNKQDGFTFKEIAEQKNISVKTVEKKIAKALETLRKKDLGETSMIILLLYLNR
jgi:DNA-binding NarL/FixJ family response regulator